MPQMWILAIQVTDVDTYSTFIGNFASVGYEQLQIGMLTGVFDICDEFICVTFMTLVMLEMRIIRTLLGICLEMRIANEMDHFILQYKHNIALCKRVCLNHTRQSIYGVKNLLGFRVYLR